MLTDSDGLLPEISEVLHQIISRVDAGNVGERKAVQLLKMLKCSFL